MSKVTSRPWTVGARSETGYVREANEDRMGWRRAPFGDIYVVADGMGGYRGGALAAEIVTRTLQESLATLGPDEPDITRRVQEAFDAANAAVVRQRREGGEDAQQMGATGLVMLATGNRVLLGHVGDSRAYLWRPGEGLRRLTRDHSRVQHMVDAGLLSPEHADDHPDASMLERAIGHQAHVEADVSAWIAVRADDAVLLCTDGLCGYVNDAEIASVLQRDDTPQRMADRLVEAALAKGGADNVTVQFVRFGRPARTGAAWLRHAFQPVAVLAVGATLALGILAWAAVSQHLKDSQKIASLETKVAELKEQLSVWESQTQAPQPTEPVPAPSAPALPADFIAVTGTLPKPAPQTPGAKTPCPPHSGKMPECVAGPKPGALGKDQQDKGGKGSTGSKTGKDSKTATGDTAPGPDSKPSPTDTVATGEPPVAADTSAPTDGNSAPGNAAAGDGKSATGDTTTPAEGKPPQKGGEPPKPADAKKPKPEPRRTGNHLP